MDNNDKRFYSSEMGVRDSGVFGMDYLQFQDLERVINLLLEDYSPPDQCYSLVSEPSTSSYLSPLIEEKSRYFSQISSNIMEIKKNFMRLYANINVNIEDMMKRIILHAEIREQELKDRLRNIAAEKIAKWDRQLSVCKEALVRLQRYDFPSGSNSNIDWLSSKSITKEIEFVDAGDLKFETENYSKILKFLQSLGTITYHDDSSSSSSGLSSFKGIAPKFTFGSGGDGPGQFCRPWGVCSDSVGRILVCDRSNHRIQIFNECGEFLIQFGREGSNCGEFNRPSGIDVDIKHRIIVADKDNHRIQVFTYCGNYIFGFGTQGTKPGQFMYPWDVAVNSKCDIAVSDSKNHRVQLFNEQGKFLALFDAKKAKVTNPRFGLRIIDSPRGLAFRPDGTLLITDFNNHRILILNENFSKFSSFGCEGMNPGQFFRPQGIACDSSGKFVVADSKNYRIQVFDAEGHLIKSFGSQGNEPGQFDCPQGICFHINQNIIVVDFNNNRVQVF